MTSGHALALQTPTEKSRTPSDAVLIPAIAGSGAFTSGHSVAHDKATPLDPRGFASFEVSGRPSLGSESSSRRCRQRCPAPSQHRQAVAPPRLDGSTPSPLRPPRDGLL